MDDSRFLGRLSPLCHHLLRRLYESHDFIASVDPTLDAIDEDDRIDTTLQTQIDQRVAELCARQSCDAMARLVRCCGRDF